MVLADSQFESIGRVFTNFKFHPIIDEWPRQQNIRGFQLERMHKNCDKFDHNNKYYLLSVSLWANMIAKIAAG